MKGLKKPGEAKIAGAKDHRGREKWEEVCDSHQGGKALDREAGELKNGKTSKRPVVKLEKLRAGGGKTGYKEKKESKPRSRGGTSIRKCGEKRTCNQWQEGVRTAPQKETINPERGRRRN